MDSQFRLRSRGVGAKRAKNGVASSKFTSILASDGLATLICFISWKKLFCLVTILNLDLGLESEIKLLY